MAEEVVVKVETGEGENGAVKWPGEKGAAVEGPVTEAALANAAARAAASASKRDLIEYLRLRRKTAA